jgi:hypothetical protein
MKIHGEMDVAGCGGGTKIIAQAGVSCLFAWRLAQQNLATHENRKMRCNMPDLWYGRWDGLPRSGSMYQGRGSQEAGDEVDMVVAGWGTVPALRTGLVASTPQLG